MATLKAPFALDRSLNTTEEEPRNIADVLAEGLSHITGRTASEVEYNNTDSGLTSDDVQGAIDELSERPTLPSVDIQTAVDEFETYNGGLLSECKVALSPNQDLHGYENPWVGGAGKNKLPLVLADIKANNTAGTWSGNVYSYNGSTITVNTDESGNVTSIDVANTPSSAIGFTLFYASGTIPFDTNLTYILNGCPSGGAGSSNYKLDIIYEKDGINNILAVDTGSGASANFNALVGAISMTCRIIIYTNASLPKTFYPMIRLATESDPTFEPYSNICPISGHTQVEVDVSSPNLIEEMQNGVWLATNGTYSVIAGYCCSKKFRIAPNKTYNVFATADATIGTDNAVLFYDENDNYLGQNTGGIIRSATVPFTFTAPSNAYYCALDLKVTLSNLLTAEIVADKEQITVNLGGTYYSGTLDVVSGVFTPDTASVDLGTLTWTYEASWGTSSDFYAVINNALNIKRPDTQDDVANAICTQYKMVSRNEFYDSADSNIAILPTPYIKIRDSRYNDGTAFQSAMNGVMLVYELSTPQSIQLSPTMVKALVGENHLSAPLEGQEITESKYKQAFTFDDVIAYIQSLS